MRGFPLALIPNLGRFLPVPACLKFNSIFSDTNPFGTGTLIFYAADPFDIFHKGQLRMDIMYLGVIDDHQATD